MLFRDTGRPARLEDLYSKLLPSFKVSQHFLFPFTGNAVWFHAYTAVQSKGRKEVLQAHSCHDQPDRSGIEKIFARVAEPNEAQTASALDSTVLALGAISIGLLLIPFSNRTVEQFFITSTFEILISISKENPNLAVDYGFISSPLLLVIPPDTQ